MKGLAALVAGAVLSSSLYAAEPSLHTTPDPGVPLVQENADKALKVAYMVAGKICTAGYHVSEEIGGRDGEYMIAKLIIDAGEQTYVVRVIDKPTSEPDNLSFVIYNEKVPVKKAQSSFESESLGTENIAVTDIKLDGHVNFGLDLRRPNRPYILDSDADGKTREVAKGDEQYFQNIYLKALDTIIVTCEGAKQ